ncbi:hypothetical protein CN553_12480 [Bacillus cereus]|uniref:Uncharacterized protein n=2 Tax=Bacillus cereus TaxID=1396 RepID=A0A9X6YMI9_BACCE|nr:hypothetical protein CN553_12480 [Bacillus cereus]
MRKFDSVSALHAHLKRSIIDTIQNQITNICIKVVQENVKKNVYDTYMPKGEYAYDRTFELLNSVTIDNLKIGTKFATFEIIMDTDKINAYNRNGAFGGVGWNAHADVSYTEDTSEYIPMWIEEGTSGSLWDRDGAHYMEKSYHKLDADIPKELAMALRREGWDVKVF